MPHIMVMHSLGDALKTEELAPILHKGFGALESVNLEAVKTYFLPIQTAEVGTPELPDNMIHIILRLKPGRPDDIRHMLAQWLHDTVRAYVNERGLKTTLSVEPLDMDYDFYKSSHA
jgi:5-carboxymethyl-2-hydroxymuconate isomerase